MEAVGINLPYLVQGLLFLVVGWTLLASRRSRRHVYLLGVGLGCWCLGAWWLLGACRWAP